MPQGLTGSEKDYEGRGTGEGFECRGRDSNPHAPGGDT